MNNSVVNICVLKFVALTSYGEISRNKIAKSYGKFMFSFLGSCQTAALK